MKELAVMVEQSGDRVGQLDKRAGAKFLQKTDAYYLALWATEKSNLEGARDSWKP